jgi:hypothetical protein
MNIRAVVLSVAVLVAALVAVPGAPADAQVDTDCTAQSGALQPGYDCTGTIPGSSGGTGNSGGGGNNNGGQAGDPRTPPTGKSWWPVQPPLGPCGNGGQLYAMYSTWSPDPNAPIVDPASPDTVQCIEPHQGMGNAPAPGPVLPPIAELQRRAKLTVPAVQIVTDYTERFLAGGTAEFRAVTPDHVQQDLGVPGFHVWIEAQPTAFDWDFDDPGSGARNSESGRTVHHLFEGTTGKTEVTVRETTTWTGVLHIDGSSDVPLEPITVEQTLTKPIRPVKSVATEPSHHA